MRVFERSNIIYVVLISKYDEILKGRRNFFLYSREKFHEEWEGYLLELENDEGGLWKYIVGLIVGVGYCRRRLEEFVWIEYRRWMRSKSVFYF